MIKEISRLVTGVVETVAFTLGRDAREQALMDHYGAVTTPTEYPEDVVLRGLSEEAILALYSSYIDDTLTLHSPPSESQDARL